MSTVPLQSFVLKKRFLLPTHGGSKDAIAVTSKDSANLVSAYTLMVQLIILEVWYIVVLVGIFLVMKKKHNRNAGVACVAIWNAQASPLQIVKLMFGYRSHIPWFALLWGTLAVLAWGASTGLSILVPRYLVIGGAAPVAQSAVYIPELQPTNPDASYALRVNALEVPSTLRAIGAVQNSTAGNSFVTIDDPNFFTSPSGNESLQIGYRYTVSGVDFGLQHVPNLLLSVEGSCYTEYDWFFGTLNVSGVDVDYYALFGNKSDGTQVSITDGKPPLASFHATPAPPAGSNASYAIVVSSKDRLSYTAGTDPWYKTEPLPKLPNQSGYRVAAGRPALSCWQNDIWSHGGTNASINNLKNLGVLPDSLILAFQRFLSLPYIVTLGTKLGPSSLKSASTALGGYFDAESSNIHDDLQRLVLGSYIATKNILLESTLYNPQQIGVIPNLMLDPNTKTLLPGADEFVIYDGNVAALSVRALIIIPVLWVLLSLIVLGLTTLDKLPWFRINALKATVLYSSMEDPEGKGGRWTNKGVTPTTKTKKGEADIEPTYNGKDLTWAKRGASENQDTEAAVPQSPSSVESPQELKS